MNQFNRALLYEAAFEDFLSSASARLRNKPRDAVRLLFMKFCQERVTEKTVPIAPYPLLMYTLLITEESNAETLSY